jgi:hypothetical protein
MRMRQLSTHFLDGSYAEVCTWARTGEPTTNSVRTAPNREAISERRLAAAAQSYLGLAHSNYFFPLTACRHLP